MRRYFLFFAAPLVLATLALTALFALNAGVTVQTNYWEVEGFRYKLELAAKPGRKIVIVSGSNAYFGVKARTFAEATGLNAVNLAMQGALPFDFYATLIQPRLNPGDIVLLPLEYPYYGEVSPTIRDRVNTLEASVALSLRPSLFLRHSPTEWLNALRHVSFQRLWEGLQARRHPPQDALAYRVGGLDEWGDNRIDYRTPHTSTFLATALAEELSRGLPRFDPASHRVRALETFIAWARERDITIIAALPNTLDAPPFKGPELKAARTAIARFWRSHGIPLLRAGATLPAHLMLDTPYHPNLDGAEWRTRRLVSNFCATLDVCTVKQPAGSSVGAAGGPERVLR